MDNEAENIPWQRSDSWNIIFKYGIITAITFSVVFFVAKILGFQDKTELRFINYVLLFPITFSALKNASSKRFHRIKYFRALVITYLICVLGQFIYSVVFAIYISIDPQFLQKLIDKFPTKIFYPRITVFFTLMTEGIAFGSIVALTTVQFFKRERERERETITERNNS